jgi:ferredoxin-thioredoxin reductase catalytic subunit
MIQILRKEGWQLNPNDKVVNGILKMVERNNGECPCHNPGETAEDRMCPCKEYRENDTCHCSLYLKKEKVGE